MSILFVCSFVFAESHQLDIHWDISLSLVLGLSHEKLRQNLEHSSWEIYHIETRGPVFNGFIESINTLNLICVHNLDCEAEG